MIDPDNIVIVEKNRQNKVLLADNIEPVHPLFYDLENEKELRKYYKNIEKEIRQSFEYRAMIQFLKENFGMDQCSFIKTTDEDDVRIEIHHYPFTLYDIVLIVYKKRIFYGESLDVQMVSKECTMLHYKLLVGLISLSKTVHQLVHDSKLFIPVDHVLGRYDLFVELYGQFCDQEQLETLERIKMYSNEQSSRLLNTSILDTNYISIQAESNEYKLPDFENIHENMSNRLIDIKNNGYKLPTLIEEQHKLADSNFDRKSVSKPFHFISK